MANFIAIIDHDAERRRHALDRAGARLAFVDGLTLDGAALASFEVRWAAGARAPVDVAVRDRAIVGIWGMAVPEGGTHPLRAAELVDARRRPLPTCDGFHAMLRYDLDGGLLVGADVLGIYPVYWTHAGDVVIVATSPQLIRLHPSLTQRFSVSGLVRILLAHAIVDGVTLTEGVRRLKPGHTLHWRAGEEPREIGTYRIPVVDPRPSSFDDDVAALDDAFASAVDRQAPAGATGVLLSGGRDSRQLAGYLRDRGDAIVALTLGRDTDYEVGAARAVAQALRAHHRVADLAPRDIAIGASLQASWEQLASGFSTVYTWAALPLLREMPPYVLCGHLREIREGALSKALPGEDVGIVSFRRGLAPDVMHRLLRPEYRWHIEEATTAMRAAYATASPREEERPWRYGLAHDARAHAGGVAWRYAFASWPVLPMLDQRVLATLASLPSSSLNHRRAQDAILVRRFPDLARVPLDRNTHSTLSLVPTPTERLLDLARGHMAKWRARWDRNFEPRYYHRLYDFNGPVWMSIRHRAEPAREHLATIFDMTQLSALVPPPPVHVRVTHPIADTFGRKLLIGLMFWSAEHAPT